MISEQDFYALKVVKVPIKRHGILSESLALSQTIVPNKRVPPSFDTYTANTDSDSDSEDATRKLLVKESGMKRNMSSQGKDAVDFLEKMDADINSIVNSANNHDEGLDEVTTSLSHQLLMPTVQKKTMWNMTDCGIHWRGIVFCFIIVGIVIPLAYFFLYEYNTGT